MSNEMLRPFIVKVSVLGYFPLHIYVMHICIRHYLLDLLIRYYIISKTETHTNTVTNICQ